ncbi:MAG: Hpt domain-containing protein [bacterium]|nr:Hpt domain-containing protein [bacterium]
MSSPDVQSVIAELRGAYLRSLSQRLQALRNAAAVRDFKLVLMHAHQLKGSGSSYGFAEISDIAARIEEAGQAHQGSVLESLLVELERVAQHLSQNSPAAKQA